MHQWSKVEAVKRASHRSWVNFKNAALKELGRPYEFGTEKVERTSGSYLAKAMDASGLNAAQILEQIESQTLA